MAVAELDHVRGEATVAPEILSAARVLHAGHGHD
jgi:hypothetical protein